VLDDDEPFYLRDWTPSNITTGEQVEIRIEVIDNIQVNLVRLICPLLEKPRNMTMEDDDINWTTMLRAPEDSLEPLTYSFEAVDPFDNFNLSIERTIEVMDNDGPTFGTPVTPESIDAGTDLKIYIEIMDNIGVETARIEWWFGGSEERAASDMALEENWSASYHVPLDSYGTLYYQIDARDAAGNSQLSSRFDVAIIEYIPPEDPGDDDDDIPGDDDDIVDPDDDDVTGDDDDDPAIPSQGEDKDSDGMDDLWEYQNGLDYTFDDTSVDPDNDGFSNLEEFEAGTDPMDESSSPLPTGGTGPNSDEKDGILLLIIVGAIALVLIIIIGIAAIAIRRRSHYTNVDMVMDDEDDDEVMSWD
jgi:hypothetical protein